MAMCVRNINFICVSMIFLIDIGTVLPMWYLLCVIIQQNNHLRVMQFKIMWRPLFVFVFAIFFA
jgi:hypothetical protein